MKKIYLFEEITNNNHKKNSIYQKVPDYGISFTNKNQNIKNKFSQNKYKNIMTKDFDFDFFRTNGANVAKQKEDFSFYSMGIYYFDLKKENNEANANAKNKDSNESTTKKTAKRFFHVYYGKTKLILNNKIIEDFIFYEIFDYINSKICIKEENNKKEKVFARLAHEFKTPNNSIIGLTNNILE